MIESLARVLKLANVNGIIEQLKKPVNIAVLTDQHPNILLTMRLAADNLF